MTQFHLVQAELAWEDIDTNLEQLGAMIQPIHSGVVVLPEMFTTGFSMASRRLAEPMAGKTTQWLSRRAREQSVWLCGSVIIEADGRYFNRFIWASPDGELATYDKRHLFRMAGEHDDYSPGTRSIDVEADQCRIRPQVCYDLRFPAWSRNTTGYHVLVYVANWPAVRREHWLALLKARAIENLCYVVAVNRVGTDGNGVSYSGDSCVIDPQGNELLHLGADATTASITLDLEELAAYRAIFPAHLDADEFLITP